MVALAALKIFEGYDSGNPAKINLTTHYLDESMKFAYGERTKLGDPSFVNGTLTYETEMLSEAVAKEARAKISDTKTFNVSYYDPAGLESLETVSYYFNYILPVQQTDQQSPEHHTSLSQTPVAWQ